jgi:flagellar biosynthesis GTPase FlhF
MTPAQAAPVAGARKALTQIDDLASAPEDSASGDRRTYRGRDLSEILPQIRAELGSDAIVTHQREGLVGGIGGFFAHRFIEVEAMSPPEQRATLDLYDGEAADPLTELDGVVAVQAREEADTGDFASALAVASRAQADPFDELTSAGSETEREALDSPAVELAAAPSQAIPEAQPEVRRVPAVPTYLAQQAPAAARPTAAVPAATPASPVPPAPAPRVSRENVEPRVDAPRPGGFRPAQEVAPVFIESATEQVQDTETAEVSDAADFMTARGISAAVAAELIADAYSHDLPFARAGGMRDALHACLSRRLPRHPGLPRAGAMVAVVGGGGSGKTHCVAALAASYANASALGVQAVVVGRGATGAELTALVGPHGVSVQAAERGSRAAVELATSRDGMLIVADTAAVSPANGEAIDELALELDGLAPEEVLVALPATSNPVAARQLLTAIASLRPTGLIVTHADETDQLGVAIELSLESGLPLVFIHDGVELPGALKPADPNAIAERLFA